MEEADQIDLAIQVARNVVSEHDAQKLGALSISIVDAEIAKAAVDPDWVIPYGDTHKTAREYIMYLVTKVLIRGHVGAGEIGTVPPDFTLESGEGAAAIRTLQQRHSAEEN